MLPISQDGEKEYTWEEWFVEGRAEDKDEGDDGEKTEL